VLGDKRGTCRSRGVEVREEEREGEEKGGERRKRGNGESERAITSVMLCRPFSKKKPRALVGFTTQDRA